VSRLLITIMLRALKYHTQMTRPINHTNGAINLAKRWLESGDPPFNVKIVDCCDAHLWYASHIGQTFTVERVTPDGYWAREPTGYLNIIFFEDAE